MSEGAKPKRSRSQGNKAGGEWVCEATKERCKRAIIVKFPDGSIHPFRTVPIAARAISTIAIGEDREALLQQLADDTKQSVLNIPIAKDFSLLVANGGSQTYSAWSADLASWENITDEHGFTVREWDAATGKKTPGKKGKAKPQKIAFDAGTYLIKQRGAPELLKGVVAEVRDDKTVETNDILAAHRKLRSFCGEEKLYVLSPLNNKIFSALYCNPCGLDAFMAKPEDIDAKINAIASKLLDRKVCGPAIVTFLRKTSVKLDDK